MVAAIHRNRPLRFAAGYPNGLGWGHRWKPDRARAAIQPVRSRLSAALVATTDHLYDFTFKYARGVAVHGDPQVKGFVVTRVGKWRLPGYPLPTTQELWRETYASHLWWGRRGYTGDIPERRPVVLSASCADRRPWRQTGLLCCRQNSAATRGLSERLAEFHIAVPMIWLQSEVNSFGQGVSRIACPQVSGLAPTSQGLCVRSTGTRTIPLPVSGFEPGRCASEDFRNQLVCDGALFH